MFTEVGESFETNESGYTYNATGTGNGYYYCEGTDAYLLQWREEKRDNNGFTITGLVDGLNVYDGNIYKATAEALTDADADQDGTLSDDELTKANLTS